MRYSIGFALLLLMTASAYAQQPVGPCYQQSLSGCTLAGPLTLLNGSTFVGPLTATSGGTLSGTFAGSPTFSGAPVLNGAEVTATGGTTARSLATRAADVVNVLDWGAKCDGSTNDTAAFQSAINAAAGHARVYVPDTGSACMVGTISVPSNSHITIDGTLELIANTDSDMFQLVSNATYVVFDGSGTLNGNRASQTGLSGAITNSGSPTYIWVRDLTMTNFLNWTVHLQNVTHAWYSYLTLTDSGNSAGFSINSSDCWADHLYISGISDEGFAFYGGPHNCGISDSYITGSTASGISVLHDAAQTAIPHDILITSNVSTGNELSGIEVNTGGGLTTSSYDITITGNRLFGNGTSALTGDITLRYATNITITGNDISKSGSQSTGFFGIFLQSTDDGVTITGNSISDEGQGSTNGVGILLGDSQNVLITGNRIFDDQTTKTMASALDSTAGSGTTIVSNMLGPTIGPPDNSTPLSDTVKSNVLSTGTGLNMYGSLTINGGALIVPKLSAAPSSAPGAGNVEIFAVAGTNSGTCKLQAIAGTSTTPVTIVDNVGSGC